MQYTLPLLTLLFIGLKLSDIITWSWWLVLSPGLFNCFATIIALCYVADQDKKRKQARLRL